MNYQFQEQPLSDLSDLDFRILTTKALDPSLGVKNILICQFSGIFGENKNANKDALFMEAMASAALALVGASSVLFGSDVPPYQFDGHFDGVVMDLSGVGYKGGAMPDIVGDLHRIKGDDIPQVNVINSTMEEALHDSDRRNRLYNLEDALKRLEARLVEQEERERANWKALYEKQTQPKPN